MAAIAAGSRFAASLAREPRHLPGWPGLRGVPAHEPRGNGPAELHSARGRAGRRLVSSCRHGRRRDLAFRWQSRGHVTAATILIADDEPAIVELVRFTLEDPRIAVIEASTGPEALDLARAARPDLILLDVHMPGLTGIEVCRRLRRELALAGTCIVMLTAASQEADRLQGRAVGVDEYLTKPFSPLQLIRIVRSLLPEAPLWPDR
jgi:CheY-like chemotaxis protein